MYVYWCLKPLRLGVICYTATDYKDGYLLQIVLSQTTSWWKGLNLSCLLGYELKRIEGNYQTRSSKSAIAGTILIHVFI